MYTDSMRSDFVIPTIGLFQCVFEVNDDPMNTILLHIHLHQNIFINEHTVLYIGDVILYRPLWWVYFSGK